jgi:hypothetical protein
MTESACRTKPFTQQRASVHAFGQYPPQAADFETAEFTASQRISGDPSAHSKPGRCFEKGQRGTFFPFHVLAHSLPYPLLTTIRSIDNI